jgi:putative aldouronate transport system substrate-binding protein
MEAWGISGYFPKEQFFVEEGQVKYAYTDPRAKEALTFLNKLYSEGLIDPEYITGDKNLWTARLSGEVSGVTVDWFPRVDFFNKAVTGVNPNAVFAGVLPPIGPDGIRMTTAQQARVRDGGATAISVTCKNKERVVQFLDYLFGEEGSLLMNFGVEGVHYDMVDGYPTFKPEMLNDPNKSILYHLFESGLFDISRKQDIRYEDQLAPADVLAARDMYVPILADPFPPLALTDDERDIMSEKYVEIQTYKDEMVNKFIMGAKSLDAFDEFVAQIKKMGIDEVLAVQQAAFDRYNSK